MESRLIELAFEGGDGGDGDLDFNLGTLHGDKYTARIPGYGTRYDKSVDLKSKTERLDARIGTDIARAADILRHGGTVAFPTETVYGLGANALSAQAVAKIFEAKQRPDWDPLIVHICNPEMLTQVADLAADKVIATVPSAPRLEDPEEEEFFNLTFDAPRFLRELIAAFWPGPLTLLLPRTPAVPDAVTAGRPLVGVRMPAHPVALELVRQAGIPIAAPSANLFGHTSPTTAAHVLADLDGRIDAVLDGGPTGVGVESTVAGATRDGVTVYRPGAITVAMLEEVVGVGIAQMYRPSDAVSQSPEALPSPGMSLRHYAPRAQLVLVDVPHFQFAGPTDSLVMAIHEALEHNDAVGVMLPDDWTANSVPYLYPWGPWDNHDVLARRLFSGLRALDDASASVIVCPVPNGDGLAAAIRDRLRKAAK